MDKLNLNVYVEQINRSAEDNVIPVTWEGNEELALREVVDPNTEFKPTENEKTRNPVSPMESYNLKKLQHNETAPTIEYDSHQAADAHAIFYQIEEVISGGVEPGLKLLPNDSAAMPQVHAYTTMPRKESLIQTMDLERKADSDGNMQNDTEGKLFKYPPERITVFSEKRGYLRNGESQQIDDVSTELKENVLQAAIETSPPLTSSESVATPFEEPRSYHRRDSMVSYGSVNSVNTLSLGQDPSTVTTSGATTDQLMWALRLARDRLDTASNISGCSSRFELDSNCSEKVESLSTISDVSGYEEEMFRIRRLLLMDSPASSVAFKRTSGFVENGNKFHAKSATSFDTSDNAKKLEIHSLQTDPELLYIQKLSMQLQNALAEKEKYKVELAEIETKLSLEWQEKYCDILRQKAHIEGRLEIVQAELEVLSTERQCAQDNAKAVESEAKTKGVTNGRTLLQEMEKLTVDRSNLQQLTRELEQQKQELHLQLELRDSETSNYKEELKETESCNEKLRIELQELRIELESKDGAIQGLKEKVADQHVEFQLMYQAKLKAENSLTSCKNEMESIRNSGNWYRDQLHLCQAEKLKIQQELMASQANVVSNTHLVEKLKSKNVYLHHSLKDVQQRAVKEKAVLMRKLEVIQADMMEREAAILSQIQQDEVAPETINSVTAKLEKIETGKQQHVCADSVLVKELEEQKDALVSELKSKDASFKSIEMENSDLLMRITSLQKTVNEKELLLQGFHNKYKHLEMSLNQSNELLNYKEQTLLDLKNEKVAIEVALAAAMKEKVEVDMAISKLREDFSRLSSGYHSMKNEIRHKNKHIESMEKDLEERVKERQDLCSEIEDLKSEKEELRSWQARIHNTEQLEKEVEHLTTKNGELQSKLSGLSEAWNHGQKSLTRLEEELTFREQQLMNQTKNFEVYTEEQNTRDKKLMDENKNLTDVNEELKSKLAQIEANNVSLLKQLECYKRQVSSADGVINQFNDLCRGSELERYNLDKQLRKALKDLEDVQVKPEVEVNCGNEVSIHRNVTSFEKGIQVQPEKGGENDDIQSSLSVIQELVERNLRKTALLTSSYKSSSINDKEDKCETHCVNVPGFPSISSKLTDLSNHLDKAIEERNSYMAELEKKEHVKDKLEFRVVRLQEEANKRHFPDDRNAHVNLVKPFMKEGSGNCNEEIPESSSNQKEKEKLETYQKEIEKLKGILRMTEIEHREKYRRYESNVRTLLKKVKEHMRGRKVAEQTVEVLQRQMEKGSLSDIEALQLEVKKLENELEASKRQYEEQKKIAEKSQSALLVLEKERGKLVQSQDVLKEQKAMASNHEEQQSSVALQFDQQARELQFQQLQKRVVELEQEVSSQSKVVRDLRKKVFIEKCENSQIKKQLASLRIGLDAANEMLDNKNIEVGRNETWRQLLSRKHSDIQKLLESEQLAHEECRDELVKLKLQLEESRAKDPVLADQIKTISYHLHQKTQEAAGLQEKFLLAEDRWLNVERNLQQNVNLLQEEVAHLRSELDSLSKNKLLFQSQASELRAALHSSLERNKVLKLKLDAYSCDSSSGEKLPDLTSSLPLPPMKYDDAQIAELLHQSTVLPNNKPLSNLQSCLDSLKQEMATLQMQLTTSTSSSFPAPNNVENSKLGNYSIQDV